MNLSYSTINNEYTLILKGAMSHSTVLGQDARGNLTRIENTLNALPERLTSVKSQLDNLYKQQEAATVELGKPFLQEQDLKDKSSRLASLDRALNIGTSVEPKQKSTMQKTQRPSVIDILKQMPKMTVDSKMKELSKEVR